MAMVRGCRGICALLRATRCGGPGVEGQVHRPWSHRVESQATAQDTLGRGRSCHLKTVSEIHRANPLEMGTVFSL